LNNQQPGENKGPYKEEKIYGPSASEFLGRLPPTGMRKRGSRINIGEGSGWGIE